MTPKPSADKLVAAAFSVLVLLTAGVIIRGAIRDRRHQAELQAERASSAQQAALAQQATAQAQATASELDEALSQRRLEEVTKLLERQLDATVDVAQAAALLARTIRESPTDVRATYRLMALLSQRDFARPLAERVFDREVVGLAWTGHGLVVAVRDGTPEAIHRPVALVSFETGDVVLRPLGEERGFREFKFIAEGRLFWVTRLAQGGPQEELWICDSSTGKAVGPPISLPGQVHQVVPEATEQRVAIGVIARGTAGYTPSLHVYDFRAGQLIGKPLEYGSGGITMTARVRFVAGGHRVLIPALVMQERSRLWNVESGNVTELPPGLPPLAVSDGVADEPQLGDTEELRRPDWLPGGTITLPNAIREVTRAAFAPDGQRLATLGPDNRRVRLWDVTPTAMRPVDVLDPAWRDPQPPGSAPEIDAVGRRVLRSYATNLVVWDKEGRSSTAPNTAGSNLVVWDLANGTRLSSWDLASTKTERVHLSPDGEWVLLVGAGQARLCAAADGRPRSAPFGATGTERVADGAFTPDGSRVLTWSETGSGQVWRVEPWAAIGSFGPHGARDVSVSVSPDSRRAATVGGDATVRVWDLDTGKEVAVPLKHPAAVNALDWAEAGEVLVTGAQDGNARIWDLRTGDPRGTPLRHGSPVTRIIVLDQSSHLVTAGEEQPAKLWRLRSGAFVRALQPGTGYFGATEVRRASGGTLLLVAGGESCVYDPTTWLPLSDRVPIESYASDGPVVVSRNGVVIAGFLGLGLTALALPEVPGPAPAWLAELAEAIVGKRLTEQGAAVSYSFAESRQVFDRLRAIGGTDAYGCWLRWYLADGLDRPLHPGTQVTRGEVVRRVAHSVEFPALNRALEFAPLDPVLQQARAEIASESLAATLARAANPPADAARLRRYGIAGQEMTDIHADDSLRLAQHVLRLVPDSEAAWKLSALGHAVLRQTNAAVQALAHVRTAPNKASDWFLRAYVLEAAGDATGAERAYAEASTLQPASFFRVRPYDKAAVLRGEALPRDPEATAAQIDLTKFYNAGLGVACLGFDARNNLGNLPAGLQVFDRIRFDARGIVQLAREASAQAQGRQFPDQVQGIPLGQKARRLHFLHGTGWTVDEGVEVGRYVIHYADGKTEVLPLLYGRDLRDWWVDGLSRPPANAVVAWAGATPGGERVCIYHRVWENPFPDREIASLDFVSTRTMCAPFLIAVTAEP